MRAALSSLARAGFALCLGLTLLAWLRWAPVYAEPPFDVRALAVFPWLLAFGVLAALASKPEPAPRGVVPVLAAAAATAAVLAGAVWLRGPVGLAPRGLALSDDMPEPAVGTPALGPGPIDLTPEDLAGWRGPLVWAGPLRAPRTGQYRLWAKGRGRVELRLDGRSVLRAEAEELDASHELLLGTGEHRLELRYEPTGSPEARAARIRGHRLRVGWVPPRADGSPGRTSDWIAPRYLGPAAKPWSWPAIDALALALCALLALLAFVSRWERPARYAAPGLLDTRAPATRSFSWREAWISTLGYALVLLAMSWPLARDLAGLGVVDREDGRLNAWILAWDAHALATGPAGVFDAPIFHPARDALAFSENLLLPGWLAAPAAALGGPVLAYNLVFLLSALISGLGAQILVRRAGGDALAGFVAGALFAAGAHRWSRIAHLHAQLTLFLPLALLALDRFWERRSLRRALVIGLVLALQALSSVYLGAIAAAVVALLLMMACAAGLRGRDLVPLALAGALAGLLVWPALAPYLRMRDRYGAEWTLADVEPHQVTLPSYLGSGTRLYASLTTRHLDPELRRRPLFPGAVPLLLGVAGLASAPRRYRAAALFASAVAVLVSLGPETAAYRFLHEHLVLLRGIRAVNRFALVPVLALCVLAGCALAGRRRLAWAALVLGLVEASSAPLRLGAYAGPAAAARWLAGREGAVCYLPIGERDTAVMLDSVAHFRPLVNGYSGFTPPHYPWLQDALEEPASEPALRLLRALGVRHVVAREDLELPLAARFGDEQIYEVPEGEQSEPAPAPRSPAPALWRDGALTLDLGSEQRLERVLLELGDRPPSAPLVVELSSDGRTFARAAAQLDLGSAILSLVHAPRAAFGAVRLDFPQRARFVRISGAPARLGGMVGVEQ